MYLKRIIRRLRIGR